MQNIKVRLNGYFSTSKFMVYLTGWKVGELTCYYCQDACDKVAAETCSGVNTGT
jgi:hypothetical protein